MATRRIGWNGDNINNDFVALKRNISLLLLITVNVFLFCFFLFGRIDSNERILIKNKKKQITTTTLKLIS